MRFASSEIQPNRVHTNTERELLFLKIVSYGIRSSFVKCEQHKGDAKIQTHRHIWMFWKPLKIFSFWYAHTVTRLPARRSAFFPSSSWIDFALWEWSRSLGCRFREIAPNQLRTLKYLHWLCTVCIRCCSSSKFHLCHAEKFVARPRRRIEYSTNHLLADMRHSASEWERLKTRRYRSVS